MPYGIRPTTLENLFERTVYDEETGCRIWQKSFYGKYPVVSYLGKDVKVHRLVYKLTHGEIPDNLKVLHTCDRPPCIEPSHLFLGTDLDNMVDKVSKNRQAKGEKIGILTENAVKEIRILRSSGLSLNDLASKFGCHKTTIRQIVTYKTWRHVL